MNELKISMNPSERQEYINTLLELDGLSHVKEDPNAAYCPISITQAPSELKPHLALRQKILMEEVLGAVGIRAYDPSSAPTSPDLDLTNLPNVIYTSDSTNIVGARYFVGHNLLPSSGFGVEVEKAKFYNRVIVILTDEHIRISHMQPHRAIMLQYYDFKKQVSEFIEVFKVLQKYDVGIGFNNELPVLLGFEKGTQKVVDLELLIYETFPHLKYQYNGDTPTIKLRAENPELFYENR